MTETPRWAVSLPSRGEPRAVVLVLHGGKAVSREPSRARHLSAARMVPVTRALHRAGAPYGVEVRMVRYRYRGWNRAEASAAADAAWALAVIQAERPGLPVVVVGHSMGGRAALRVADDPVVVGVVALAPWVERDDPVAHLTGQRIRILHGSKDRWTSPRASAAFADAAAAAGADVRYVDMGPVGHFMIRRRGRWQALTTYLAVDALLAAGLAGAQESARGRTAAAPATNDRS
ncbi:MAG TPA: alpha/beta fold hydrolase [Mycobacteriales bacterium]